MVLEAAGLSNWFSGLNTIAVGISRNAERNQNHVGLLYRRLDGRVFILHLAWHLMFFDDEVKPGDYLWVKPALSDFNLDLLHDWVLSLGEKNQGAKLPYGIHFAGRLVDDHGLFVIPDTPGIGLTCATFVMQLLDEQGFKLIETDGWPVGREEDVAWQENILSLIRSYFSRCDPALLPEVQRHVEAQHASVGRIARFRPEEVAGAFSLRRDRPLVYEEVVPAASWIQRQLVLQFPQ